MFFYECAFDSMNTSSDIKHSGMMDHVELLFKQNVIENKFDVILKHLNS